MLHVAIYDGVNGIRPTHEPYMLAGPAPSGASVVAAASAAARAGALVALYPGDRAGFDALHAQMMSGIAPGAAKEAGSEWGSGWRRRFSRRAPTTGPR